MAVAYGFPVSLKVDASTIYLSLLLDDGSVQQFTLPTKDDRLEAVKIGIMSGSRMKVDYTGAAVNFLEVGSV